MTREAVRTMVVSHFVGALPSDVEVVDIQWDSDREAFIVFLRSEAFQPVYWPFQTPEWDPPKES
jgi:hypothetical protein